MKTNKKRFMLVALLICFIFVTACAQPAPAPDPAPSEPQPETPGNETEQPSGPTFPTKPIRIITHSEPGGGVDIFIRALQPYIQFELGQPIVIENVPGAAGRIGTTQVWNSDPDGYTLLSHTLPLTTVGDIVYDAEYNILEFEHLVAFDKTPYVIAVKIDSDINTFEDLVNESKERTLTNATSGVGGSMHLQSVVMKDALGIDYADIPFNGSAPAMMAVMTNDVDFAILPFDIPLTNLDEVKVIVAMDTNRMPQYPDIPTVLEEGYEFELISIRRCIVAPKGTPQEINEILINAFEKAAENPDYLKWAEDRGVNLEILTGDDYYRIAEEAYEMVDKFKDIFQ